MFFVNPNLQNIQRCVTNHSRRFYQTQLKTGVEAVNNASPSGDHKKIPKSLISSMVEKPDDIYISDKVIPITWPDREPVILSFEDMPGPKFLKYLSTARNYLSQFGTQLTAGLLTVGLDIRSYMKEKKTLRSLSSLFDDYGPVVRFVSPLGNDIVLTNHPEHIQKVFATEGEYPVRSALDCLEKYRLEHRSQTIGGLFNINGEHWSRQRKVIDAPLHDAIEEHISGINQICDTFVHRIYNTRDHRDEINSNLYQEIHKWAFDCMGLVLFSKNFTVLEAEIIYSQDDMTWLYHSLDKATDAIANCESGLRLWKLFKTPAWYQLVKHCDSLDNLIGKQVLETEQVLSQQGVDKGPNASMISAMLREGDRMSPEDVTTAMMDMLLIGVNTITSSMSFLIYHIAKHGKTQKKLAKEVKEVLPHLDKKMFDIRNETPYLQACIKETLRLVPPIPILSRILSKNITLDRYNIPQGTLIIMSTQDSALKESNFDDAEKFYPERWLSDDAKNYHAFASIPFGCGARKCIGQNIAETMMSILMIKLLQKYKLEFHYGDIRPTRSFISKPNKPLKIRFIDRL